MNKNRLKRALAGALVAATLALPLSYAPAPAPAAEADGFDIAGAIIGGAIARSQLDKQIKYYNDTEKGRQEFLAAMKEQYGVDNDWALNQQLDRIMTNLTNGIGQVDPSIYKKPYNYFINNDDSFNAFCTMGHNLSVNRGLYKYLTNEDEIAVVLGHEMGHGQKDHPAKGARKSTTMAALAQATGSNLGAAVVSIINNRNITKPMEREADALSFDYITHTNYNPGACAAVWQRVLDRMGDNSSSFQAFVSDHPADDDRRDAYVKKLTAYSNNHVTDPDGTVRVNGKALVKPAAAGDMSSRERSYFVMGNLAAAYHNGHDKQAVSVSGNTVMLGPQPIITCTSADESAQTIADRLAAIK